MTHFRACLASDLVEGNRACIPSFRWCVVRAEQGNIGPLEKGHQHHAGYESADMREIGNPAVSAGKGAWHRDELAANPDSQHKPGRNIDKPHENDDQEKCAHRGARVKDEIGTKNAGDAAGGANHRHPGRRLDHILCQCRGHPAQQVETGEPYRSH